MKFRTKLSVSVLLSSSLLTGCGSDDESTQVVGANYSGKTTDAEMTDANSAEISLEMQAAVKAVSFVRYEENLSDYDLKYTASIEYAELLNPILSEASNELSQFFGEGTIPSTTIDGDCVQAGSAVVSGTATNLSVSADEYCVDIDYAELTLSGSFDFALNTPDYSINLNDTETLITFSNQALADNRIKTTGSINYSVNEGNTVLNVDSSIDFDGVVSNSNVTETCVDTTCTIDADVQADNGSIYRAEDITVSRVNGYRGDAYFYLTEFGKVRAYFYNIQYCEDGSIGNGSIFISNESGPEQIDVYFNGCGEEVITSYYAEGAPR